MAKPDNATIRILHKSKDGVKVKLPNGQIKNFTWEEFNANCEMVDKYWAKPNKIIEEIQDKIGWAATYSHLANTATSIDEQFRYMAMAGAYIEEIQKATHWSILQIAALMQQAAADGLNPLLDEDKQYPDPRKARAEARARERLKKSLEPKPTTQSLADFPGAEKLKNLFTEEPCSE